MSWDAVAADKALRIEGLTLEPSQFLPDYWPQEVSPGRWEVEVMGRMSFQPAGKRVVLCKGKEWVVEKPRRAEAHEECDPLKERRAR